MNKSDQKIILIIIKNFDVHIIIIHTYICKYLHMYTYICKYVYIVLQTDMHIKNVIYGEKIIERTLLVTRSIFTVSVCTSL